MSNWTGWKGLKSLKFKAATGDPFPKIDSFGLLRMLCYPLTIQQGEREIDVRLIIKIDGQIKDVVKQKQVGVLFDGQMDLRLARYYFLLQNHEPEDLEDLKTELKNPRIINVEFKVEIREKLRE